MTTLTKDIYSDSEIHGIDLNVRIEKSLDIRVENGSFKFKKVTYTFSDDIVHTVSPDSVEKTMVVGWIQKDDATGVPELVIDEMVLDGSEVLYDPPKGKTLLHRLFDVMVPPSASDIANEDITVFRIVPPPPKQRDK